jgi:hypothetical protein
MSHAPHKVSLPLPSVFLGILILNGILFKLFVIDHLPRSKVPKRKVSNLHKVNGELLMQRISELLSHKHEQVEDFALGESLYESHVQTSFTCQ